MEPTQPTPKLPGVEVNSGLLMYALRGLVDHVSRGIGHGGWYAPASSDLSKWQAESLRAEFESGLVLIDAYLKRLEILATGSSPTGVSASISSPSRAEDEQSHPEDLAEVLSRTCLQALQDELRPGGLLHAATRPALPPDEVTSTPAPTPQAPPSE